MISCIQNSTHGNYVLGARINESTYRSMVPLMSAAGYKNVSSFVRDAMVSKCRDIATELTEDLEESVHAR